MVDPGVDFEEVHGALEHEDDGIQVVVVRCVVLRLDDADQREPSGGFDLGSGLSFVVNALGVIANVVGSPQPAKPALPYNSDSPGRSTASIRWSAWWMGTSWCTGPASTVTGMPLSTALPEKTSSRSPGLSRLLVTPGYR